MVHHRHLLPSHWRSALEHPAEAMSWHGTTKTWWKTGVYMLCIPTHRYWYLSYVNTYRYWNMCIYRMFYVYRYINIYIMSCIYIYVYTYMMLYLYAYIYIYMYMYIYISMYDYICTCMFLPHLQHLSHGKTAVENYWRL